MPKNIWRDDVQPLLDAGAQLVDVLPAEEFEDEHLPGSISIPLRQIDEEAPGKLDRSRPVVVYCYDSA